MLDDALLQGKSSAFTVDGTAMICKRSAAFLMHVHQNLLNTQILSTLSQFFRNVWSR
ncbi:hypothetical protein H4S14_000717 [Agrobacterium vitis]|nr:hypothetical protein [Agrobacterium vitis]MBE1436990.1 hypothetical protein [Agrobacterium vitis]